MQLIAIVMRMLERYHTDICSKIILTYLNDIPFEKDHTFFSSFQIFLTVAIVKKMLEYFHTFFTTFQSKKIALFFFSKKISRLRECSWLLSVWECLNVFLTDLMEIEIFCSKIILEMHAKVIEGRSLREPQIELENIPPAAKII